MTDAIAGHDPKDATSLASAPTSATTQIERSISGLRIGIDRDYALQGIDPGQAASIEEALKVLAKPRRTHRRGDHAGSLGNARHVAIDLRP